MSSKSFIDMSEIERRNKYSQELYNKSKASLRGDNLIEPRVSDSYSQDESFNKLLRLIASNTSFYKTMAALFVEKAKYQAQNRTALLGKETYLASINTGGKMIFQYNSIINIMENFVADKVDKLSRQDVKKLLDAFEKLKKASADFFDRLNARFGPDGLIIALPAAAPGVGDVHNVLNDLYNKQIELKPLVLAIEAQRQRIGSGIPRKYM
jgi:hypothetical protein